MKLRPYQEEIINKLSESLTTDRCVVSVCGCGSGKSVMSAKIAKRCTMFKKRVLFIVHRKELITQIKDTYAAIGVDFDCCDFMMIQTYRRHLKPILYYDLIIIDECHLNYKAYQSIVEYHSEAKVIGWTATPVTLNGGLGHTYSKIITGVTTQWLIEHAYLAPYTYYSVRIADTQGLHVKSGEFDASEVAELMQDTEIYGSTVEQWEKLALNKKTIVYCSSIQTSIDTCQEFSKHGYSVAHIDGSTPSDVRSELIQRFKHGDLQILCNMDLFGVGLDVPNCECTILLRPTKSLALYIQQSMRSMRYQENKHAIIIDHVGNCYLHGLPDDNREWSLKSKKTQENTIKIKECPECYAVYEPSKSHCPYCGTESHMVKETTGRKTIDVNLVEVKRQEELKETQVYEFTADTFDAVVEYQKLKGYKFMWALRYCMTHDIKIPSKYNYMIKRFLR